MIRFIWQNWWRRKERFILLIIGAFIVSAGLTYLIGLSETNRGTIVDNLEQRWSASYDIVVRPEGTRSVTEDKKLLEPNYLSGLSGGISLEQYEEIKDIPGVEVAAPIAMIGYAHYQVRYDVMDIEEDGLYRKKTTKTVNNGIWEEVEEGNSYFPINVWDVMNKGPEYGVGLGRLDVEVSGEALLAGIDPEQEAKLVGLDEAITERGTSRYFSNEDTYHYNKYGEYHEFPIIVNQTSFVDKLEEVTFEKLDIEIDEANGNAVMEDIKDKGGFDYLNTIEGNVLEIFAYTGEEIFHSFVSEMTGVDWETGEVILEEEVEEEEDYVGQWGEEGVTFISFKPTPITYEEISSPYAERWPYSYQIVLVENGDDVAGKYKNQQTYREAKLSFEEFADRLIIKPNWIGIYDASELAISTDPTTELPMETYRPATAEYVMDAEGNPMNPPEIFQPTGDPYNFITDPPSMLTTIEAAAELLGDEQPISSIRIKVAGVTDLSEESQDILERVAGEIEEKTGLITDITLGSSPQLALTYVPGLNGGDDVGWLQQPWVNIGSSISLFKETKVGFSTIVASVIVVAIVYVWASGIVNLLARRKEFAVLLSIGWRPKQLNRMLFLESSIIGLFVACISWIMLGIVYVSVEAMISFERFLWTGLFGFIVYLLGSIIPMLMARNISPYEAMRSGEITGNSKRLFQARGIHRMAFNHFIGKWKRSFLSVISIALPTALLAVFLYITFRLRGIMYTSMLGEYVALEIGPTHYAAIIVALIIAILTTAEIMWQNVSERREEISLLQSVGWRRWSIRRLILAEGVFSGLFAAFIGLSLAFVIIWGLYAAFPTEEIGFILATGLIPIIIGVLGTILPAERAVRIVPHQGIGGNISNRKVVEQRLKWVVATTFVVLIGTFLFTMIRVAPNIETANSILEVEQAFTPTEGDVEESDKEQSTANEISLSTETPYEPPGDYFIEFQSDETIKDAGWGSTLAYEAKETESSLAEPEPGMRNLAIEFNFEILDNSAFGIVPRRHFSIQDGDESYRLEKFTLIAEEGWEEQRVLQGIDGGKLQGILEFTVPEDLDSYGLHFLLKSFGNGIMVYFDS